MKITGIVLTKDEEKNIKDCLESIKWLDEILIIDSGSIDKTLEIAKEYTQNIYQTENLNIPQKRQFALEETNIKNEWILFIDADERLTPELINEIEKLSDNKEINGYYINRRNYYLGKWIKHCGINPDYTLRLFRKSEGRVTDRIIHEGITIDGSSMKLKNDMLHFSYNTLEQAVNKINFFSTEEAKEHLKNGKIITKTGVFTHAFSAFLRVYISRKGFMDGLNGLYVSFIYSAVNFLSHLKLLKLRDKI